MLDDLERAAEEEEAAQEQERLTRERLEEHFARQQAERPSYMPRNTSKPQSARFNDSYGKRYKNESRKKVSL